MKVIILPTGLPITQIPFPTISICAQGFNYDVFDAAIFKIIFEYHKMKNVTEMMTDLTPFETAKLYNNQFRGVVSKISGLQLQD